MTCEKCENIVDRKDLPHSIRECSKCGRTMYVQEVGEHGRGINIREGDTFVIPKDWLKLSFDPLKSSGQFSKGGLQWFANLIFLGELPNKREEIEIELNRLEDTSDNFLRESDLLEGLDIDDPEHAEKIVEILQKRKDSGEWWAFLIGVFLSITNDAIEKNDIKQAVWATACAERCRSMLVFKEHLEAVVWMGHSAQRLVNILRTWDANKNNKNEEFWQLTFNENSYVLSQVFSVPVVFIKDKAYVGGMNIDRKEAKFVDYLYSGEASRDALLIEIKTPKTKLLGAKYRGVYRPSAELSGAVVQVMDYRNELIRRLESIISDTPYQISIFNPKCILIVGNGEDQLDDDSKRSSFELFRSGLKDVEIVTYDELFRKVEILASLFNLIRRKESDQ